MSKIRKTVKKFIPPRYYKPLIDLKDLTFDGYATKSYSFVGEDMVLRRIFNEKTKGFYVDVGAHHPRLYSNTYYFYKKGWRGINIDAMPGSMRLFNRLRPKDINIEAAVFDKKQTLTYYMLNDSALNGFSRVPTVETNGTEEYRVIGEIKVETSRLKEILDSHLPQGTEIDFLSVDVERSELEVLRSNDWDKYRPKVILVESIDFSPSGPEDCKVYRFLVDKGYYLFSRVVDTLIFIDDSFKKNA